ncbi:MAG: hypothetical protein ACT4QC_06740 [Planctomycetaceae bacterium]
MKKTNGRTIERIFRPVTSSLNDQAARKLMGLKADAKLRARVSVLARKCNEGELTRDERVEYESLVLLGDFVAILQVQARRLLARSRQPA